MELYFKPGAVRVIKKLNQQERTIVKRVLQDLKETPEAGGFLKGSLVGLRKWKFRIASVPYRIVYQIKKERLEIIAVGRRKDFYELLK